MTDIKVPSPGESIAEVEIGTWLVAPGSYVDKDQEIVSLESEKASLIVNAPVSGLVEILVDNGARAAVGSVIGRIEPAAPPAAGSEPTVQSVPETIDKPVDPAGPQVKTTPVARKIMQEHNLSIEDVLAGLRRISREDVLLASRALDNAGSGSGPQDLPDSGMRTEVRKKMSMLREKLSQRLVAVKNETAMLTTFNEIDMSAVVDLRNRYKAKFEQRHGVKLGFMSFFTLAATRALMAFPQVNSQIDGDETVEFNYVDIGIAVQTPKGLMVPILRDTNRSNLADLEKGIAALAEKARENRITIEDLKGGTFSITNGGVFGSLLSTPILNPPQPAILGMHNIVDRPVAYQGSVVIRPMMYVALSYDHRLIDGKDSVSFLKTIKELIENPFRLLDPSGDAERSLLDL